jgi:hypothetical protein
LFFRSLDEIGFDVVHGGMGMCVGLLFGLVSFSCGFWCFLVECCLVVDFGCGVVDG